MEQTDKTNEVSERVKKFADRKFEKEANLFATLLLVPGDMLRAELERQPLNLGNDARFKELCKMFDVSETNNGLQNRSLKTQIVCKIKIIDTFHRLNRLKVLQNRLYETN